MLTSSLSIEGGICGGNSFEVGSQESIYTRTRGVSFEARAQSEVLKGEGERGKMSLVGGNCGGNSCEVGSPESVYTRARGVSFEARAPAKVCKGEGITIRS